MAISPCNKDTVRLCSAVPNTEQGSRHKPKCRRFPLDFRKQFWIVQVAQVTQKLWSLLLGAEASGHDVGHQFCLSSGQDEEIFGGPFQSQSLSSWKNKAKWLEHSSMTKK